MRTEELLALVMVGRGSRLGPLDTSAREESRIRP
jgi:hypothetical protein